MATRRDHVTLTDGLSYGEALAALRARELAQIARHGWYAHLVFDSDESPTGYDVHSHGIADTLNHPDFQVVLPLPGSVAHKILKNLADAVRGGQTFKAGSTASGIIDHFQVGFISARESDREVLRVILPDERGRLLRDEVSDLFRLQYRTEGH